MKGCGPTIQRVMVTVADERANSCNGKFLQTVCKSQLSPQTAIGGIIDVARHKEEIYLVVQGKLYHIIESSKGGIFEKIGNFAIHLAQPTEGTVQVQVSSMNK
jgi:F0F1-type ATP synthase delta subunit